MPVPSRLPLSALAGLALAGCAGGGGAQAPRQDDDGDQTTCAGDPGAPRVELCSGDEAHTPLSDGAVYEIARRVQGDITIFSPLWFAGAAGGEILDDLEITFTAGGGEQLGRRHNNRFQLPCEPDGTVAAHFIEVFFLLDRQPADYDGATGSLRVAAFTQEGILLDDSVDAELSAAEP